MHTDPDAMSPALAETETDAAEHDAIVTRPDDPDADPEGPDIEDAFITFQKRRDIFAEVRADLVSKQQAIADQQAEADDLERQADALAAELERVIGDPGTTPDERRTLAERQAGARYLATEHRKYAEKLGGGLALLELRAKVAAADYLKAWKWVTHESIKSEFDADILKIRETLLNIVRRQSEYYEVFHQSMSVDLSGYAQVLHVSRPVFCAIHDLNKVIASAMNAPGDDDKAERVKLGDVDAPDFSPFSWGEIDNPMNQLTNQQRLERLNV